MKRPLSPSVPLLTAALASAGVVALAPSIALAVPAGGYADLVETVSPSVVFIEVTGDPSDVTAAVDPEMLEALPEALRRQFEGMRPNGQNPGPRNGVGTGFIISETGEIVTNHHVIEDARTVTVTLTDGRVLEATVIGSDPLTDIALLQVDAAEGLPYLNFGSSDAMRAGDEVFAVGNPFGLGGTVTSGIVSATSRDIHAGPYDDFIQTDAAINLGNSGGPLFNNDGEVIGVNTAIFSPGGGSVGIGFAVPSDLVQTIVADLEDDGVITRGWLGVQIRPMTDEVASVLGYDAPRGAVIEMVQDGSPAALAGLEDGDIILTFNGKEIDELRDLTRAVAETAPDAIAQVEVLHRGTRVTYDVTIGTLGAPEA